MAHCWYHIFTKYFPITCTQAQTALRSHYSQIHYSWIGRRQCYLHKHTQLHMRAFKIVLHFPSPLVDLEERKVVELFKRRRGMKSRFIVGFNDDGEQTKRWRLKVTKPRWKEWEVPPSRLLLPNYKSTSSTSLSTSLSPSLSTSMSNKSGWKWQKRLKSVRGASIKVDYSLPAWLLFLSQ